MEVTLWYGLIGAVFIVMALSATLLRRLPLSTSMLYLLVGIGIGPAGLGLLELDPLADAELLERLSEVAVLVSLFTAGLKLRAGLRDPIWRVPLRLAFLAMLVTVALIAAGGVALLGLPLGVAVLLGAILAPTDPVLASDVQVRRPGDRDQVRFDLTAEAGLNDGMAFPFVMLGLGLLGRHDLGPFGVKWLAVDVVWAILVGLSIGFVLGTLVSRLVLYLRKAHREAIGLDNFLALGLIGVAYGAAVLVGAWGFLAVFAAGLAVRHEEMRLAGGRPAEEVKDPTSEEDAVHPEKAPAVMTEGVLKFNEQAEQVLEVAAVLVLGALLAATQPTWTAVGLAAALFFVIRPASVYLGLAPLRGAGVQTAMIGWFGVRGVGSMYYLTHAIGQGVPADLARTLSELVVWTIALSVIIHGVSVTPAMNWYAARVGGRGAG